MLLEKVYFIIKIVRWIFPWPGCGTNNSISGHVHYYLFHIYAALYMERYTDNISYNIPLYYQILYSFISLLKTYLGGYHNLRHFIMGFAFTNIFYSFYVFFLFYLDLYCRFFI